MSRNDFGMIGSAPALPALLTRMSTAPIRPTPSLTASRSVTSNGATNARPPAAMISSAIACARSARRSFTATVAPWPASARAIPAPTFCPAPVTSAVRPVMSNNTRASLHGSHRSPSLRGPVEVVHTQLPLGQELAAHRDATGDVLGAVAQRHDALDHLFHR